MNMSMGLKEKCTSACWVTMKGQCIEQNVIANFNSKHAKDAKDRFIEHFAYVFYRLKDGLEMYFSHIFFPVLKLMVLPMDQISKKTAKP